MSCLMQKLKMMI